MKLELELDAEDVRAIDELAALAETTRDRVVHWALRDYLRIDDLRMRAMVAHPAGRRRLLRSA